MRSFGLILNAVCLIFLTEYLAHAYVTFPPNTTGSKVRIEFFRMGDSTDNTACDSSPCTIYSQSGAISSVTRSGTGNYTVNFTSGMFSAAPACSCWVENGSGDLCYGGSGQSATAVTMNTFISSTQLGRDNSLAGICVGLRP